VASITLEVPLLQKAQGLLPSARRSSIVKKKFGSVEFLAGSVNGNYGIYRNHCCGNELVLYRGIKFPNCVTHNEMQTRWHLMTAIPEGTHKDDGERDEPAGGGRTVA